MRAVARFLVESQRSLVVGERLLVRIEACGDIAGGFERLMGALANHAQLVDLESGVGADLGGAREVVGDHRDHGLGAVCGAFLDERRHLGVLAGSDRLRKRRVGDVADQNVLERVLALAGEAAAGRGNDQVLVGE